MWTLKINTRLLIKVNLLNSKSKKLTKERPKRTSLQTMKRYVIRQRLFIYKLRLDIGILILMLFLPKQKCIYTNDVKKYKTK